jgi:hypothetical protein
MARLESASAEAFSRAAGITNLTKGNKIMKAGIISQSAYWCFLRIFPFDSARIRIRPAVINVIPMI